MSFGHNTTTASGSSAIAMLESALIPTAAIASATIVTFASATISICSLTASALHCW
jgi:hypothetical protein